MPQKRKCECGSCRTCVKRAYNTAYRAAHNKERKAYDSAQRALNREITRAKQRLWYQTNKQRVREYGRAARAKDPDKYNQRNRAWKTTEKGRAAFRRRAGVRDPHIVPQLERFQGGVCAICMEPRPANNRHWHADHDHTTGLMRGMLCHHCNHLLGNARDSLLVLVHAIHYLQDPPAAKLRRASNT